MAWGIAARRADRSLDLGIRSICCARRPRARKKGIAVIAVLHDLNLRLFRDRVVVLSKVVSSPTGVLSDTINEDILRQVFGVENAVIVAAGGHPLCCRTSRQVANCLDD